VQSHVALTFFAIIVFSHNSRQATVNRTFHNQSTVIIFQGISVLLHRLMLSYSLPTSACTYCTIFDYSFNF